MASRSFTPRGRAALDRRLASSVAWVGTARTLAQGLSWVVSILVARILSPGDYGIMGMATLLQGLLLILSEFGLTSAIVAHRDLDESQLRGINALALIVGLVGFVIAAASAIPLAAFFRTPALLAVIPVLSIAFPLTALRTVPQALLQRDLRFREVALIDFAQAILQAGATLTLALLGFHYWSLVGGVLIAGFTGSVLSIVRRPTAYARPDIARIARTLRLSGQVLGTSVAWYTFQNSDFLVVGRRLGQGALGIYTMGWTLAVMPLEKVWSMLANVTRSFLAAATADRQLLVRYLLLLSSALLLVVLPATVGLAVVAPDAVQVLVGSKWADSVVPLRLLAVYSALRCLGPLWTQVLTVTDDQGFALRINVVAAFVLPLSFYVGSHYGLAGVATVWMVVHPLVIVVPLSVRVSRRCGITLSQQVTSFAPAVVSTAVMAAGVTALRHVVLAESSSLVRLAVSVFAGAVLYFGTLAVAFRHAVLSVVRAIRLLRPSRPTAAEGVATTS